MVEFSYFYESCGCNDLGEVQLEHGCKLSIRRRMKQVLYIFKRLVNLFLLLYEVS